MAVHLKTGWPQQVERQQEVIDTVSRILREVEHEGEPAIRRWSAQLDGWEPPTFVVPAERIKAAAETVDDELAEQLEFARSQVERFARAQRDTMQDLEIETLPGVVLGHRHLPVAKVGSYSPGGRYPLIASSIMTVTVPKVAGVDTVVAVAPPRDGQGIYGPQLYTMDLAGADVILCLGGVQAFAALAFGVEDVAPVDLVVGAGNAYVAEAKRQLFGTVGIDLLAGPTEVAVIADETADPRLVAADLLGQAEHGFNSPALLVTTSHDFGTAVIAEVDRWLGGDWPTVEVAGTAWREHGTVVVCESREEAVQVSDAYAPEHLEVQTAHDDWYAANLRNYGSLFIGPEATVAFSDKSIGTNHVLPTGRAARYTGGLWVGKFLKTVTYQRLTPAGARTIAPSTAAIADAELMYGHALTARLRLN
ncbi:histidinol dehydrogenase [Kribbella albertanoniae]|uniref:Histidinol dehydrogenase n=1 Tax=Kribbella albertanoniae TaxID=1266829 RepID=A0A4R4P4G4_9ACTN|nr:histidinol dehydrogenase [Kribbella albertanoniae]TDC15547.1 histidinol dehydrogenase [Kribbella albertanoniae]